MEQLELLHLLEQVQKGTLAPQDAVLKLRMEPFEDLGYAKVDHHRGVRQGVPEVIFGGGKSSKLFMPSRLDLLPVSKFESFLKYYTQKSRGILDPQERMRALRSKEITAAPAEPAQAE